MSKYLIPSLETLSVEIVHRVFDNLDAHTILSSVRGTCRRFQALVNSYDRFVLNFKQISRPNFEHICCLIEPQNVTSLILSNDHETEYEIDVFISRFHNEQFSRLRSLTLIEIKESQLKSLLTHVNLNFLISFSLKIDSIYRKSTVNLLLSVISQSNLRRFEFDLPGYRSETLTWPVQCMIQHLIISAGARFYPCMILQCSPNLHTLVGNFSKTMYQEILFPHDTLSTSFRQVKSLTLENLWTKVETLEMLLSLVPSLTHLKLTGGGNYLDGNRWEQFIQMNLSFLNKFEFFVQKSADTDHTRADIESIIATFRTPFWLEHKKWLVTCEYNIDSPRLIQLYSIPICMSSWIYQSALKKVSLSTSNTNTDNEALIMNNVTTIQLNFQRVVSNDIPNKVEETRNPLFRKVENLEIEFDNVQLSDWTFFISTLIDLTRVVRIKLLSKLIYDAEPVMLAEITDLLKQTCNLSLLDFLLSSSYPPVTSKLTAEDICLITPSHVRHLSAPINSFNEIQTVLERLKHLSSVKFDYPYRSSSYGFIKWLKEKRNGSAYIIGRCYMYLWIGKKFIESKAINVGAKRIKLSKDS